IERYEPSILWNDISWPTSLDKLLQLFADYYNAVPEGVVNDRWVHERLASKLLRYKLPRRLLDFAAKRYLRKNPQAVEGVIPQEIPHSDFRTPEFTRFTSIQKQKWEATRGMSHSFGYNRLDTEESYAPAETLLADFIDGTSKGGNLLLNVGPRGEDAKIPDPQLDRLRYFGDWLATNGDAIYGTVPWWRDGTPSSDTVTEDGIPVRFTRRGDDVYIIPLGKPSVSSMGLRGIRLAGEARLVADGSPGTRRQEGDDLLLGFRVPLGGSFAPVITVTEKG